MKENKCHRCGKCCREVGRTFWKAGCILFIDINRQFGDCKALNDLANNGDHEDGGLPCEMLSYDEKGKAVCGIEELYGKKYKPTVCEEYPDEGEKCFFEQRQGQMALFEKET